MRAAQDRVVIDRVVSFLNILRWSHGRQGRNLWKPESVCLVTFTFTKLAVAVDLFA